MQPGREILEQVQSIIDDTLSKEEETNVPLSERVITQGLLRTHKQQEKHFLNCLDAPDELPHLIFDRFGRSILRRGTKSLEAFWGELRGILPAKCSIKYFLAAFLCQVLGSTTFSLLMTKCCR